MYEKKAQAKRSRKNEKRVLEVNVIDRWGHRPVSDITRKDVRALVEEQAETAPQGG
ncbi:MAG: hypothetical protein AB7J35_22290 [Dehalococcoidia bacterium]